MDFIIRTTAIVAVAATPGIGVVGSATRGHHDVSFIISAVLVTLKMPALAEDWDQSMRPVPGSHIPYIYPSDTQPQAKDTTNMYLASTLLPLPNPPLPDFV